MKELSVREQAQVRKIVGLLVYGKASRFIHHNTPLATHIQWDMEKQIALVQRIRMEFGVCLTNEPLSDILSVGHLMNKITVMRKP